MAGIEARGFILAAPVALRLHAGFVPVRKQGKLPAASYAQSYDLEYGTATIEVHRDAFSPGERVLIVDDVLATGGTARATAELVRRCGAEVAGISVLLELGFLAGRARLAGPGRPLAAGRLSSAAPGDPGQRPGPAWPPAAPPADRLGVSAEGQERMWPVT